MCREIAETRLRYDDSRLTFGIGGKCDSIAFTASMSPAATTSSRLLGWWCSTSRRIICSSLGCPTALQVDTVTHRQTQWHTDRQTHRHTDRHASRSLTHSHEKLHAQVCNVNAASLWCHQKWQIKTTSTYKCYTVNVAICCIISET